MMFLLIVFLSEVFAKENMTEEEKFRFEVETNPIYAIRALKYIEVLMPKDVVGKEQIRVGNKWDGGYTLIDDFSNVSIAYSLGVGIDWSFDADLTNRGINVFMFDPTIKPPFLNNSRLKFYRIGLAGSDIPKKRMMTLESMLKLDDNLNRTNMILKLDVEGAEWEAFLQMDDSILEKFCQIFVEFHDIDKLLSSKSDDKFKMGLTVFEKLNKTHQLVWFHGQNGYQRNYNYGRIPFPTLIEVGYIKRTPDIKFTEYKKKKRTDDRSFRNYAEYLVWWLEGKDLDLSELQHYYGVTQTTDTRMSYFHKPQEFIPDTILTSSSSTQKVKNKEEL